jgi:hypothetical protein
MKNWDNPRNRHMRRICGMKRGALGNNVEFWVVFISNNRRGNIRTPDCLSLRRNKTPPTPQASVSFDLKGGGITLRGWRDPIRTTGKKAWHSVYCAARTHLRIRWK